MPLITLTERCHDWNQSLQIDEPGRLVQNVALSGTDSRNGYAYTEEALRTAVELYRDKPVFLDHGQNRSRPQERSTRDLVGSIISPRFVDGRIRGDIRVLDTDSGRTFLKLVESAAPGVGMSHVVLARRSSDGKTVDRIDQVISVDAVVNPATTTTFREAVDETPDSRSPSLAALTDELQQVREERDRLRQQNIDLQTALDRSRREESIQSLIQESQLPLAALSPSFLAQLRSTPSEDDRRALIQDRMSLLSLRPREALAPHSHARSMTTTVLTADAQFINAIRRR